MSLTVEYKEVKVREGQSPNYTADLDGQGATRFLMFDWDDIDQAEAEILGYSYVEGGEIKRVLPECDPVKTWLYAARVSDFQGLASDGYNTIDEQKLAKYKKAILRVDYCWRPYPVLADDDIETEYDRFVEVEDHSTGDYVTPRNYQMLWVSDGKPADVSVGKIVPYQNVTFRWHQVPYAAYPAAAIDNCNGRVNSSPLGIPSDVPRYFAEGTLLFLGARRIQKSQPVPAGVDRRSFTLEYFFRKDPANPNTFLDFRQEPVVRTQVTKSGVAQVVGSIPDGLCIYNEGDLNTLFEVPA